MDRKIKIIKKEYFKKFIYLKVYEKAKKIYEKATNDDWEKLDLNGNKFWNDFKLSECIRNCANCPKRIDNDNIKCYKGSFIHCSFLEFNNIETERQTKIINTTNLFDSLDLSHDSYIKFTPRYFYKLGKGEDKNPRPILQFNLLSKFLGFSDFNSFKNESDKVEIKILKNNREIVEHIDINSCVKIIDKVILNRSGINEGNLNWIKNTFWAIFHVDYLGLNKDLIYSHSMYFQDISVKEKYSKVIVNNFNSKNTISNEDNIERLIGNINFEWSHNSIITIDFNKRHHKISENEQSELSNFTNYNNLQLRFELPKSEPRPLDKSLIIGQFIQNEDRQIVSGTVVFKMISEREYRSKKYSGKYKLFSEDLNKLCSKYIQWYLNDDCLSLSESPSGIFSEEALKKHLLEKNPLPIAAEIYDIFFAVPVSGLLPKKNNNSEDKNKFDDKISNETLKIIKDNILELIDHLNISLKNKKLIPYSYLLNHEINDVSDIEESSNLIQTQLSIINNCKYFVIYIPFNFKSTNMIRPSSIFLEAGYAIARKIPVLIASNPYDEDLIPYTLHNVQKNQGIYKISSLLSRNNKGIAKWIANNINNIENQSLEL
ncbi:MAG: hypothetical protein R2764_08375 [Bacteroidales bacterium]